MNKLIVLGTGNGGALKCYNTCFALQKDDEYFLVDGGGGNQIIDNLKTKNIDLNSIHNIFVSHNHIDHIIGIVWLIRLISIRIVRSKTYNGNLNIYASDETIKGLNLLCDVLLSSPMKATIGDRIILHTVNDKEEIEILGCKIKFIDIHARKDKQFGFKIEISNNKYLSFLGDEPCDEKLFDIVKDSEWLLHESFCLDTEQDRFKPHEKGHCTVKEASIIAEKINPKNLILWHTEDSNLENRKELYTNEAMNYFKGKVYVPNDLEIINL